MDQFPSTSYQTSLPQIKRIIPRRPPHKRKRDAFENDGNRSRLSRKVELTIVSFVVQLDTLKGLVHQKKKGLQVVSILPIGLQEVNKSAIEVSTPSSPTIGFEMSISGGVRMRGAGVRMTSIGVFSTWMAFGGNTHDLGSFKEETDKITELHQILEEVLLIACGDGVTGIKRRRRDPSDDGVRDLVTASGRGRLNVDLESSTEMNPGSCSSFIVFRNPFSSTTIGDENPIRTLGDYSKPSHEGYRNTIELPVGNNVDLALYDNKSWNDPRDFAKPVKAITLPQDVPSTSDRHLIELENQVQRLMEAHLAPTQPTQVNRITTPCEICSGPHDTQYCMEDPEQAFVEYASSRTDEAGGLVSSFMASQDVRLSKLEADFKQQQGKMTNKIDTVLRAITDQIAGTLPSDTVKNPKLSTSPVSFARSYPAVNPQCSTHIHGSINATTIHPKQQGESHNDKPEENEEGEKDNPENIHVNPSIPPDPSISFITEKVLKLNSFFESLGLVPQSSNTELVCTKGDDDDVMFIEIVKTNDDSHKEEPEVGEQEVEYFDIFPTRSELAYHKRIKGMHVFIGNFTYIIYFMIVEDISSIIDPRLWQVVLGRPFVEISNMTHDPPEGVVRFTNGTDEIAYKMPHKIEQYNSLSDLEKEHTKSVYLRNEEDKRRGVKYVMNKILGFYKECLELGPKYATGMDDEGEVT
ncbi:hypothetical protein Tco_0650116 [Tanacetum coccineum]